MRKDDPSRSSENETSDSAAMRRRWGADDDGAAVEAAVAVAVAVAVAARNADAGEAVVAREMAAERRRRVVLPIVISSCSPACALLLSYGSYEALIYLPQMILLFWYYWCGR
jgi:hypothetical protein